MKVRSFMHIAICVRDLEKSLHFYRDILGMKVTMQATQPMDNNRPGSRSPLMYDTAHSSRYVAFVWLDDPAATEPYLVLSSHPSDPANGEPIKLDQIGITHISFGVDDVPRVAEELIAKGVPIAGKIEDFYDPNGQLRTFLVHDPDQILVQFEQTR